MRDDVTFEARLADALGRYADLAPTMDDAALARQATAAGRSARWTGWVATLRGRRRGGRTEGRAAARTAWLLIVLALALVAVLLAVAGGAFQRDSRRPLARNGAIALTVQGNDHEAAGTHLMNADGTGDRLVEAGRCPTYSKDGSLLASLAYEDSAYLVVAGADGKPIHKVPLVESPLTSVVWAMSPDGKRVAWFMPTSAEGGSGTPGDTLELWMTPIAGGPASRILPGSSELRDTLSWSPDGRHIAFGTYVVDANTGERRRTAISIVATDGSGLRSLTSRPGLLGEGLSWSPDGRFIAYLGLPDAPSIAPSTSDDPSAPLPPRDVFVIGADGTDDRNLTGSPAFESQPEWSPDGGSLAFVAAADGGAHRLATIRMNGPTPAGQPVLGPETAWFVWSPDGTRLLWLEFTTLAAETYRSTLHSIDRDFREAPVALQVIDGQIVCPPSWQRLEP